MAKIVESDSDSDELISIPKPITRPKMAPIDLDQDSDPQVLIPALCRTRERVPKAVVPLDLDSDEPLKVIESDKDSTSKGCF